VIQGTWWPFLDHLDDLDILAHLSCMERIGIVGLGAIGGSLALACRDAAPVLAWSRDAADREGARAAGIDVCGGDDAEWPRAIAVATILVVAVPMDELAHVVAALLPHLPDECLLLHASSLQRREALGLSETELGRVLGTHPIAGSERSGFAAADSAMFRGATVRAEARATAPVRARVETLWRAAGAVRVVWDDAAAHDALMAWVSHLSQMASTALAAVLAEQGISPRDLGPGARDVTRLAKSDFGMWAPILAKAPQETVIAMRRLTSALRCLGDALEAHDAPTLGRTWNESRAWRTSAEDPA